MYIRSVPKNNALLVEQVLEANDFQFTEELSENGKSVLFKMLDADYLAAKHLINHITGDVTVEDRVWYA